MMNCYGKKFNKLDECEACQYRTYCEKSGELPLMTSHPPTNEDYVKNNGSFDSESPDPIDEIEPDDDINKPRYSRADMLECIAFIVAMDDTTLTYLSEKLQDPELSFSEIARRHGITRQAVHKFLRQRCQRSPELIQIFQNRVQRQTRQRIKEFGNV